MEKSDENCTSSNPDCQSNNDFDVNAVKVLENVNIKIGEAKKLVPGNRDARNCYCSICLDCEEVCKTHVIEKSLSPFFQEEFNFDIPHDFRFLCFYLHDLQGDMLTKKDVIFAKVVIKKSELCKYNGQEHWFPLVPTEQRNIVQGQLFVEIKFLHHLTLNRSAGADDGHKLFVRIPECCGLFNTGGSCDRYVAVTLQGIHRSETKKSRIKKSTTNPHFDDEFIFELNKNNNLRRSWFDLTLGGSEVKVSDQENWSSQILKISLFNSGTLGDEFMGEIVIPLSTFDHSIVHTGWYLLSQRDENATSSSNTDGSMRIKVTYTKDYLFPSHVYDDLCQRILHSAALEPAASSWTSLIGAVCGTNKWLKAATSLVRIFIQQGHLTDLILPLADEAISSTKNNHLVFRNSSFTSCLIEESMRVIGSTYLHNVLASNMEKIKIENKQCEIDPSRVTNNETSSYSDATIRDQLHNNMDILWEYVSMIIHSIVKSASSCPPLLCEVFTGLRNFATIHYPDDLNMRYTVVTNFLFLRYFSTAILCPKKYKLINEEMSGNTSRTFALISKIVQHLCNISLPVRAESKTSPNFINVFFRKYVKQDHVDSLRNFIDIVSSTLRCSDTKERSSSVIEKVVLKEGKMVKRAQGRTFLLGRKNFKTRYFSLTNYDLSYGKRKDGKPLCVIPVQHIKGIEKLEEDSFRMANMFQVIQSNHVLYCKANNSVEQKEWMDVLCKVCTYNRHRAQYYHPGAYVQGKYTCCGSSIQKAPGCTGVTGLPTSIRLNIDLDRDLERIYKLLNGSIDRIHQLQEECGARAVYTGPDHSDNEMTSSNNTSFDVKDPQLTFRNLCSILECVKHVNNIHARYDDVITNKDIKQGTKERPYGDS